MFDQETDKTFVGAERRAMNAERDFLGVVLVFVAKIEPARLREIDLVGRDGKLAPDRTPCLHVDLRSVERSFVRDLDKIDPGILEHIARHFLGLFPKLWFIDKLLTEFGWIVRDRKSTRLNSSHLGI